MNSATHLTLFGAAMMGAAVGFVGGVFWSWTRRNKLRLPRWLFRQRKDAQ